MNTHAVIEFRISFVWQLCCCIHEYSKGLWEKFHAGLRAVPILATGWSASAELHFSFIHFDTEMMKNTAVQRITFISLCTHALTKNTGYKRLKITRYNVR